VNDSGDKALIGNKPGGEGNIEDIDCRFSRRQSFCQFTAMKKHGTFADNPL